MSEPHRDPSRVETTDAQDEVFDVLDSMGNRTGVRKPRGSVHRDGDWHAAIHIWVGSLVDGVSTVVLQRRSSTKDTWPGRVDIAVGGHLSAGEGPDEGMREAREEIGLELSLDDVTVLGRRFVRSSPNDNEVQDVFAVRADLPLDTFTPHPLEVEALLQLPIADAIALLSGLVGSVEAVERARDATEEQTIILTADAFVPEASPYYAVALAALDRVVAGKPIERFLLR
jgi:isopentenyldiphosphate isomerase